ncbi:hypothetical protein [Geomonas anaerohicana]|uniref:Uncharacterized protein n=1 Tax=Geomonas anaerohicana TaxID=2798583 RepID=A0ABS0YAS3_9BACT|nr:hypothetical protein [Geomonas anaerohicana]MBJ6749411.1 hypothetical protein [Geomonas anaerohicana]
MILAAALLFLVAGTAAAAPGDKRLLLFAKNPATWSIVKDGARGKLGYRETDGVFTLTASGLAPRSPYALVRYQEAPSRGAVVARGTSDAQGKLVLQGIWHSWAGKFWVVSGEDVAGAPGSPAIPKAWRPERYLFEEKPLGVPCACPEPEEP